MSLRAWARLGFLAYVFKRICHIIACLPISAALVGVVWLSVFVNVGQAHIGYPAYLLLFSVIILSYVADRLWDIRALGAEDLMSDRQAFGYRWRRQLLWGWCVGVILTGVLAVVVFDFEHLVSAVLMALVVVVYLIAVQVFAWFLHIKELVAAMIYAAGISFFAWQGEPEAFLEMLILYGLFAGLCFMNLLLIAFSEREVDQSQGKLGMLHYEGLSGVIFIIVGGLLISAGLFLGMAGEMVALWIALCAGAYGVLWLGRTHVAQNMGRLVDALLLGVGLAAYCLG